MDNLNLFYECSREWYDIIDNLNNTMITKPFDKNLYLEQIHLYKKKVKDANQYLMKCESSVNKDLEWGTSGLDCESIIFTAFVEFALNHGITLDELQSAITIGNENPSLVYNYIYNKSSDTKETDIKDTEKANESDSVRQLKNDLLDETLSHIKNLARENTEKMIKNILSVSMNETPQGTLWCVTNDRVMMNNQRSKIEILWFVLSFALSFFMGLRYLVTRNR
jgi:hypothetical protein